MAQQVKSLVLWPPKDLLRKTIFSTSKAKYPKLRCTLDCSKTFIYRPRDLYLQATAWSDYKHHNTIRVL